MRRLLVIHKKQFGYHTDTYEIVQILRKDFNISILCFDSQFPKREHENVKIKYVSFKGSYLERGIRFIKSAILESKKDYTHIHLIYFPLCCILGLYARDKIILDFRTGSISKVWIRRLLDNSLKSLESSFFNRVSIISEGLRKKLRIPKRKSFILPLGAKILSKKDKVFDFPRLFYIGTFNNRNIEKTIEGVSIFLNEFPQYKSYLTYDIIGSGDEKEEKLLKQTISNFDLFAVARLHGRKTHEEAQKFFDSCNIGVSYIPMTSYFKHQPPTKTYEYIKAGMLCIGTATNENKKVINSKNGVLCKGNPNSFANSIKVCVDKFMTSNSTQIRDTLRNNSWKKISENFKGYLLSGE